MRLIPVVAAAIILAVGLASAPVAAGPIHEAAYDGDLAKIKSLLASGVKIDARKSNGSTPLFYAKTAKITKFLLKAGARVNARTDSGVTPLHVAHTPEIAKVLLKAGIKISSRDDNGVTPLHEATVNGFADVVEFLLSAGADAKAKDNFGHTPFDIAINLGFKESWSLRKEGKEIYWLLHDAQY